MKNSETIHLKIMITKKVKYGNTDIVQIHVHLDNMKEIHVIVDVDLVMILKGIVKKKAITFTIIIQTNVLKDIIIPDIMQNVVH